MLKKHLSTIIIVLVFVLGLGVMAYPTVSDRWNARHQSHAIATYSKAVENLTETDYSDVATAARAYNETLPGKTSRFEMTEEERQEYDSLLNVSDNGVMGVIDIPKIDVSLPIYHGTDEGVLQIAVGHLEGSSLPVGGTATHSILSGHRGLPSAKLFTNLDKIEVGDTFYLTVLNDVLTYEVDQILTVLPEETEALAIDPEQDYCTLVTCTPYGINTHRLLVRGHRVETPIEYETVHFTLGQNTTSGELLSDRMFFILLFAGMGVAIIVGIGMILHIQRSRQRSKHRRRK